MFLKRQLFFLLLGCMHCMYQYDKWRCSENSRTLRLPAVFRCLVRGPHDLRIVQVTPLTPGDVFPLKGTLLEQKWSDKLLMHEYNTPDFGSAGYYRVAVKKSQGTIGFTAMLFTCYKAK